MERSRNCVVIDGLGLDEKDNARSGIGEAFVKSERRLCRAGDGRMVCGCCVSFGCDIAMLA